MMFRGGLVEVIDRLADRVEKLERANEHFVGFSGLHTARWGDTPTAICALREDIRLIMEHLGVRRVTTPETTTLVKVKK
jgi:hypothetical protein